MPTSMNNSNEPTPAESEHVFGQVLFGIGVTAAAHPLAYAKVLVQIGHEPLPPFPGRNIFGRKVLLLPNVFKYVGHIRKTDGFFGLYRGLGYKIVTNFVGTLTCHQVKQTFKKYDEGRQLAKELDENTADKDSFKEFLIETGQQSVAQGLAIVTSQPFYVLSIRCMAQFVGKEDVYNGPFSGIGEIMEQEGVFGFFSGLIPRLLGELCTLWLANTVTHIIANYILEEGDIKQYVAPIVNLMAGTLTYPFSVVSACMVVNNCGLAAGSLSNMPAYKNWIDCWHQLSRENALKRGSSMLFRYYTGLPVKAEPPVKASPLPPPPPITVESEWKYN